MEHMKRTVRVSFTRSLATSDQIGVCRVPGMMVVALLTL